MPLLNYRTKVPVQQTMGEIQSMLARAGARSVATSYDDNGEATGVLFQVRTGYGLRNFSLPVRAESVRRILSAPNLHTEARRPGQHERVAWRIVKDWLEAQLAIIETEMVTLDQVMLPYMQDDSGQTIYELYRDKQLALGTGA